MSDPTSPTSPTSPQAGDSTPTASPVTSASTAAVMKFKSCRWRRPPEDGPECCGHRDVLPIAGINFNPDAWCLDCTLFKLRRTPKKRSQEDYRY